jgi:cell division protein FtsZ
MFEIQDAAKIITESVDPNARIIFGTVRDEKLKKGEVRVTVIASNFPENFTRKSLFQSNPMSQSTTSTSSNSNQNSNPDEGKIYNSVPTQPQREEKTLDVKEDNDDDDWGAVPAFLRRSKLK